MGLKTWLKFVAIAFYLFSVGAVGAIGTTWLLVNPEWIRPTIVSALWLAFLFGTATWFIKKTMYNHSVYRLKTWLDEEEQAGHKRWLQVFTNKAD